MSGNKLDWNKDRWRQKSPITIGDEEKQQSKDAAAKWLEKHSKNENNEPSRS